MWCVKCACLCYLLHEHSVHALCIVCLSAICLSSCPSISRLTKWVHECSSVEYLCNLKQIKSCQDRLHFFFHNVWVKCSPSLLSHSNGMICRKSWLYGQSSHPMSHNYVRPEGVYLLKGRFSILNLLNVLIKFG